MPLTDLIRAEIAETGPLSFSRFMELALYHPEHGYYRRPRDPFGAQGDFYTAEQLQPVFGSLIRARVRELFLELPCPADFTVVELGAGRGEMTDAFSEWKYVQVDLDRGELPARFTGVVFSNEFFDALPVEVAVRTGGAWVERRIDWDGERFVWRETGPAAEEVAAYLERYVPEPEEGMIAEAGLAALRWMECIAASLESGFVLTIDYGYTARELRRFPQGTLMAYRRHTALEDVLGTPGERDITAHVNFTALQEHGAGLGLEPVRLEPLSAMLLSSGEDAIAGALRADTPAEEQRRRAQLKTLLFSMGETFRALLQHKRAQWPA